MTVSNGDGLCVLPSTLSSSEPETGLDVSISLNGYDYTKPTFQYNTYGVLGIAPKQGPIKGGTEIIVKGFGFVIEDDYKVYCRFGIQSDFIVVDAIIADVDHLVCVSPPDFKVPKTAQLPLDVPLEVGFAREGDAIPWTNSDNKFRFY